MTDTSEEAPDNSVDEESRLPKGFSEVTASAAIWLLLFSAAAYLCLPIYEPAFFGHLAIGRWIVSSLDLPHSDLWTAVGQGKNWVDTEWLFDVVVSAVEQLWGFRALILVKLALTAAFVIVLYSVVYERSGSRPLGVMLALAAGSGCLVLSRFSPALPAWSLFLVLANELYRARDGLNSRPLLVLCAAALYTNLHLSVVWFIGFLGLTAVGLKSRCPCGGRAYLLPLFVGLLISPYFGSQLLYALTGGFNFLNLNLGTRLEVPSVFHYEFVFLLLLLAVFLIFYQRAFARLYAGELATLLVSVLLGFAGKAFLPFAIITVCLFTGVLVGRAGETDLGPLKGGLNLLGNKFWNWPARGTLWLLTCIGVVLSLKLWATPLNEGLLPVREAEYILEQQLPEPLLNTAEVGSYLVYKFADAQGLPKRLAAIDSRAVEFAPEAAQLEAGFASLPFGWSRFPEAVGPKTVICRVSEPFCQLMQLRSDFQMVFKNGLPTGIAVNPEDRPSPNARRQQMAEYLAYAVFVQR